MTAQSEKKLVAEVLKSPAAYRVLNKVQDKLQQEKQKRNTFYETVTEKEKAEFINGEIVIHSPVMKFHNEINLNIYTIINTQVVEHNLGFVGVEKILIQLTRNDYEPDLCYFDKTKAAAFTKNQMFFPVPNMIVEVLSKSTEKRDRGIKFEDYQNHGVQEYWIVDPNKETVEQYVNDNGTFDLRLKSNTGKIKSTTISNFQIPIEAIFNRALAHQFVKEIMGNT